jgi:integrase
MVDSGTSPITLNTTITGLKFFFEITLGRGELMARMQPVRVPRTIPVVLSREEVSRLIAAAPGLKYQTALSIAYGTGLRAPRVTILVACIDPRTLGSAMKDIRGTLRTDIQGQSGSSVVAA